MKIPWPLCLGGFCLACQGCSPLGHAARTSIVQPAEYNIYVNEAEDCVHDFQQAKEALEQFKVEHADTPYSTDFGCGFKKGYADYLYAGGTGNPPPLPPRCYWNSHYQSPEGHRAIEDWFAGFKAGATAARQSGKRELVTVPASTALAPSFPSPEQVPPPQPSPPGLPAGTIPGLDEVLPPPRTLPRP
jgi:hypothetical protein